VPVARLAVIPALIAASTATEVKIKSLPELIEYGRKNPGKLNYSSAGVGSYPHYDAALFAKRAGFEAVHVPTRAGAAGMITDMMTGQVHWGFINAASSMPVIQSGQLTPLAVITDKRLPELPNVPTVAELGFPGAGTFNWQGLYAAAATPPEVLQTLSKAVGDAMATPAVKAAFEKASITADPTASLDEARRWMQREIELWKKTTEESGVTVN
jgi:tripartite-type tricarboxylate transporter receptor subunit TctC